MLWLRFLSYQEKSPDFLYDKNNNPTAAERNNTAEDVQDMQRKVGLQPRIGLQSRAGLARIGKFRKLEEDLSALSDDFRKKNPI